MGDSRSASVWICVIVASVGSSRPLWSQTEPPATEQSSAASADQVSLLRQGFAENSFEERIYFEIHGQSDAPAIFLPGISPSTENTKAMARDYVQLLGGRYRVLLADYPLGVGRSDPPSDPERMTADQLCEDWLAIADEAGVEQFALFGYSWTGNAGLQLASRSERVSALIVGGWPALEGPYEVALQTTRQITEQAGQVSELPGIAGPPGRFWQQYVTYYESIQSWPERKSLERLTCPRLNYVDREDVMKYPGATMDLIGPLRSNETALRELGWEVVIVDSGSGHLGALACEVAGPIVAAFLDRHLLPVERPEASHDEGSGHSR